MAKSRVTVPFLVLLANACAAPPVESPRKIEAVEASFDAGRGEVVAEQASAATAEKLVTAPAPAAVELAIWSDPAFRARFAESLVAETDVEPRTTAAEREVVREALDLVAEDRSAEAVDLLRAQPGEAASAVIDFTLASFLHQRDELDAAATAYRAAVEKFPRFRRAWRNLGILFVRQGEFDSAVDPLRRVVELGGGDGVVYGLLGFACSSVGDELAAESAYRMANLLDPATIDWKLGLARCFVRERRWADAAALCGRLLEQFPERADLWLLQASAFLGMNQPLAAAENHLFVERLGRATPATLETLGDIWVAEGLLEAGADSYMRMIDASPNDALARGLRAARLLVARNGLDEARRVLDRMEPMLGSSASDVERKDVLKLRARLAVATGSGEDEARLLQQIVELDPLDGEALLLLGQHARRSGDPERAIFWFERAAGLESFEADAKVRHAQVLVDLARSSEALPLLRRAQALKPRDNVQEYLEQVERATQAR